MRACLSLLVFCALEGLAAAQTPVATPSTEDIRSALIAELTASRLGSDKIGGARFWTATANLDDDPDPEAIVYLMADGFCGSGGCNVFVYDLTTCGLQKISRTPASRPPIGVLDSTTNGWRDISVHVAGGGILNGYQAVAKYEGQNYTIDWTEAGRLPGNQHVIWLVPKEAHEILGKEGGTRLVDEAVKPNAKPASGCTVATGRAEARG